MDKLPNIALDNGANSMHSTVCAVEMKLTGFTIDYYSVC